MLLKKIKNNKRFNLIGIFLVLVMLVSVGQTCGGGGLEPPGAVTLEIWRSDGERDDFDGAMSAYSLLYPNVSFIFKTFEPDVYEDELFAAWSKGEGPDIFSVPNWRVGKFRQFITPMPQVAALRRARIESSFGRDKVIVEEDNIVFPVPSQLRDIYPGAISDDVLVGEEIFGLPYSFDTLAMYYNRDLLARAQIAVPPANWEEFRLAVEAITVLDNEKNIIQPAAGIGTASNIDNFFDIVSVIMMQNGANMTAGNGTTLFAFEDEDGATPGLEALDFYTKFSDPDFKTYTWNDEQLSALESFTNGDLAFFFGYYRDKEIIEGRAPTLNFSHAKIPQIDVGNPINYPSYFVDSVHIGSGNSDHAWNFIRFMASEEQTTEYLARTGGIPVRNSMINRAQEDPEIGRFVQQALRAKSWYHGIDPDAAHQAFVEMIDGVIEGSTPIDEVAQLAQSKVNVTIQIED